ncbi:uncharacterized protein LOC110385201 isoform X1 [Bombyx mori]|uniref:Uncharacterized protein n=1 Tax=Bombyx mori TaxID=7091 RepID=A0A8R2HR08_BOMMO|nr:uncharacterized protein LOC110385201 [Bombyx mori]
MVETECWTTDCSISKQMPQEIPRITRSIERRRLYSRRFRNMRPNRAIPSGIGPEWVMELERCRVESEEKLADAALIMAEAARTQALAASTQADLIRKLVELLGRSLGMTREQRTTE